MLQGIVGTQSASAGHLHLGISLKHQLVQSRRFGFEMQDCADPSPIVHEGDVTYQVASSVT
jgi:hypothetical protein